MKRMVLLLVCVMIVSFTGCEKKIDYENERRNSMLDHIVNFTEETANKRLNGEIDTTEYSNLMQGLLMNLTDYKEIGPLYQNEIIARMGDVEENVYDKKDIKESLDELRNYCSTIKR